MQRLWRKCVVAGTIEGTINTCLEIFEVTIFYITENRGLYILVIRVSVSGEGRNNGGESERKKPGLPILE